MNARNVKVFTEKKEEQKEQRSGIYKVFYIKYEWMPGKKLAVWNKRGNTLEFADEDHARFFLEQHPEAVCGCPYEICSRTYDDEDQMEYGRPRNIWEGL